jgi:hypothetical protein
MWTAVCDSGLRERFLRGKVAMSDVQKLAVSIAHVLPETADPYDELTALGLVVTGVICEVEPGQRGDMVDYFCRMLRKGVVNGLN